MAEDEEAEVAESKSARHGGPWLVLSWLLFTITVAAPFFLVVATALVVAAVLGADWAALRSGGLALSGEYILVAARWGIVLALISVCAGLLALIWGVDVKRERVLGPGGRVLRVLYGKKEGRVLPGPLGWIPEPGPLVSIAAVLAYLTYRTEARWLALPTLILLWAALHASIYVILGFGVSWLRSLVRLLRFAGRTPYRAGLFTGLFFMGSVAYAYQLLAISESDRYKGAHLDKAFEEAEAARVPVTGAADRGLAAWEREGALEIAEALWPQRAFDAGTHRFLAPLLAAGGGEPALTLRLEWLRSAYAQTSGDPFRDCVLQLYPDEASRGERRLRSQYRFTEAVSYDVALGALLAVCENHALRKRHPNLAAAFWTALGNDAKKRTDPKRKYRREVSESALGSDYLDCGESPIERCPSPSASPDEQAALWEEIAHVQWCELSRDQRTLFLQKAILDYSDEKLAAAHSGLTAAKAKASYQYLKKKIKTKLTGSCRGSIEWPDLDRELTESLSAE